MKMQFRKKKIAMIVLLCVICIIIIGKIAGIFFGEKSMETVSEYTKENTGEESGSEATGTNSSEEAVDGVIPAFESGILSVCAPADFTCLREQPGLSEDILLKLYPGEQVIWDGIQETVDEQIYYHVTVVKTGEAGYLPEEDCVQIDFNDPVKYQNLPIVEINDSKYTYDKMVEDIEKLIDTYSECISAEIIGTSLDGRDIYELTLGNPDAEKHILVQGGIHGREYMTSQLLMKLVEYYGYYYEDGSYEGIAYNQLLYQTAIHVIPMVNPDGVTISQLGVEALQQEEYKELVQQCYEWDKQSLAEEKNTEQKSITFEEFQKSWKANARGVDLNCNFDADWENLESKELPSYAGYKGTEPASEPESEALRNVAWYRVYDYYISYHSSGQLIYYDVQGNTADTSLRSEIFASNMKKLLKLKPVNTTQDMDVHLGGFGDWVQLFLNGTSVTLELGKADCPLAIEEFPGIWYRNRESWAMLLRGLYA